MNNSSVHGAIATLAAVIPVALFAGCTCGETHNLPDASFDAPLDVSADAFTPPPFVPTLMWRAEGAGMCPEITTPIWDPPAEPPIARGGRRWVVSGDTPVSTEVEPTFIATGDSFWALDLSRDGRLDYLTGRFARGEAPIGSPIQREVRDTEFRWRLPRMTLGRNTIVIRDLWSLRRMVRGPGGSTLRSWTFPVLDDLYAYERSLPLVWPPSILEQTMPAWNPVTGQLAFTVGTSNAHLAVQCPGDDMGQFILFIGSRNELAVGSNPYTQIFYRENGELILHRNGQTHIISPTGEVLRTLEMGQFPRPIAYDQTCGVLYNVSDYGWQWWDMDAMSGGPILQLLEGASLVYGSEDCGIIGYSSGRIEVAHPDDTHTRILGNVGAAIVGGWAMFPRFSRRVEIVNSQGVLMETIPLEDEPTPGGVLTPDGNMVEPDERWYLGYPPALPLGLNTGLNWAHTNSPLPE